MDDFLDRVVLVTGAGRGVGRAVAAAFAAQGGILAVNDLTPINLDETVRRILAAGWRAKPYIFDVAKRMPVQAMVDQVAQDWGRIDILVNAAVVRPHASLFAMDEWDWNRTLEVNLGGAFYAMQTVGRVMQRQGGGCIVNLGIPLLAVGTGSPTTAGTHHSAAYLASKEGLRGLTRLAAVELAADQIRVNAVCLEQPGSGEAISPEQAADLVLQLCSPSAAQVTGQVIFADGSLAMC